VAKAAAKGIIQELRIEAPSEIDIEAIAWMRKLRVEERPMSMSEGRLIRSEKRGVISVNSKIRERGKKRFVIAHEVGHFELHKKEDQLEACTDADLIDWYKKRAPETASNVFAAELLMPSHLFEPKCDVAEVNLNVVKELTYEFNTTLTATAIRFVEFCPERCALVMSRDGKVLWPYTSQDFGYRINKGYELDPYSLAYDYFKKGSVDERPQAVSAESWIESSKISRDHDIIEHSIPFRNYNLVLTMLWIKVDADY